MTWALASVFIGVAMAGLVSSQPTSPPLPSLDAWLKQTVAETNKELIPVLLPPQPLEGGWIHRHASGRRVRGPHEDCVWKPARKTRVSILREGRTRRHAVEVAERPTYAHPVAVGNRICVKDQNPVIL